jgi:hypothetical protein
MSSRALRRRVSFRALVTQIEGTGEAVERLVRSFRAYVS